MSNAEALKTATVDEHQVEFAKKQKAPKKTVPAKIVYTEGMEVLCGAEKRKGTLIRLVKEGIWQVQIGFMKMEVPQRQMIPAEKPVGSHSNWSVQGFRHRAEAWRNRHSDKVHLSEVSTFTS